jgi:hypothetical protein
MSLLNMTQGTLVTISTGLISIKIGSEPNPILNTLQKEKGRFHHSSFLAGGATTVAGSLVAEHGVLKVQFLGIHA